MFADRAQSIAEVILPALAAATSSSAIATPTPPRPTRVPAANSQRAHPRHARRRLRRPQPDLTLLLLPSLDPPSAAPAAATSTPPPSKELTKTASSASPDDFYRRIYAAYEAIATREPHRVAAIREDAPIEQIESRIKDIVAARLGF